MKMILDYDLDAFYSKLLGLAGYLARNQKESAHKQSIQICLGTHHSSEHLSSSFESR